MSTPALGGLPAIAGQRQYPPVAPQPAQQQPSTAQPAPQQSPAPAQSGQKAGEAASSLQTRTAAAQPPENSPPSTAEVRQALDEMREAIQPVARSLHFSIDEDTGKTMVKVIDTATDEVIRQIPSEEIIAIAKALDKLQGLLLRQEA